MAYRTNAEIAVEEALQAAMINAAVKMHLGQFEEGIPLAVDLRFYIKMPRCWSRAKKERSEDAYCLSRPDVDNYVKFVLDAMNGVLFKDDNQVAEVHALKLYSAEPRTEICVETIDDGGYFTSGKGEMSE